MNNSIEHGRRRAEQPFIKNVYEYARLQLELRVTNDLSAISTCQKVYNTTSESMIYKVMIEIISPLQ